jgi:DNA invertase Pin-like site-specific DNA recombinase
MDAWMWDDPSRPEWDRLMEDIGGGRVEAVVCLRLDQLGKTCSELVEMFGHLTSHKVNLISINDDVDLSAAPGRRKAEALGSIAVYERSVRAQRIPAGQAAARARGIRWGGSEKGRRFKVTSEMEPTVKRLRAEGWKVSHIARKTALSRPTIYKVVRERG